MQPLKLLTKAILSSACGAACDTSPGLLAPLSATYHTMAIDLAPEQRACEHDHWPAHRRAAAAKAEDGCYRKQRTWPR